MAFRRYLDIKILDVKIRAAVLIPASPIPRPWLPSLVGTHLLTLGRTNGPGRQYRRAVLNRGGQPVPGRAADQPVERPRTRGGGSSRRQGERPTDGQQPPEQSGRGPSSSDQCAAVGRAAG